MARMIPPVLGSDPPPGEKLIYQRLAEDPDCQDWIVLHSLHLAEVRRAVEGEIDFVIIIPEVGVLCLEVKSHRTADRGTDGLWRLGKDAPTHKSPFEQAARGMHSVLDFLGRKRVDLQQVPIWSAVWFTHASANLPDTPEWHSWQLLDRNDLRRPVSATLRAVMGRARHHFALKFSRFEPAGREPNLALCEALASRLRPRFELSMTPREISAERAAERLGFIEEQYEALDLMEQESRALFTGPAGTGKSFLAAESARRAAARGESVLFVCFNRLLGAALRTGFVDTQRVYARTLHGYMLDQSGLEIPDDAAEEWWEEDLPVAALETILDRTDGFDVLIVDEVQDVAATPAYLDVLDASLVGGLAGGRWLMFGDFEKQLLYGGGKDGRDDLSARCPHYSRPKLFHNCRNTPQIGAAASRLSGLPSTAYKGFRRRDDGVAPSFRAYGSQAEQERLLLDALDSLRAEHYHSNEIVILSTRSAESVASRLGCTNKVGPYGRHGQRVPYTTIHAFKGLDAPAVIVTDVEAVGTPATEALLYVALSRASDRLIVLASKDAMTELAGALVGGS